MNLDSENSSSRPVRYLGYVDAVRGLGILGVLVVHTGLSVELPGAAGAWTLLGRNGVQLFYIASAFTLFLSFDGRKEEARPTSNFFIRRFFRIAPAFYLAMTLNFLALRRWPDLITPFPHAIDFMLGFAFLHGFKAGAINSVTNGSWSVADEAIFYCLIPWLHRWLTSMSRTVLVLVSSAILLGSLSELLAAHDPAHALLFEIMWFPVEFPVFLTGILAYQVWKRFALWDSTDGSSRKIISALLLLCVAGMIDPSREMLAIALGSGMLVLALALHPWSLFVNRSTRFLGKISYSMYLFHFYVLHALNLGVHILDRRTHGWWHTHLFGRLSGFVALFALVLIFTVPFCTLTWLFVEEPFIRLGRRMIAAKEARASDGSKLMPEAMELVRSSNTPDNQF